MPITERNYGSAIMLLVPELEGQPDLTAYILTDLRNRGFSSVPGPKAPFPQGLPTAITNLGIKFLHFVLEPDLPSQKGAGEPARG